MRDQLTREDIKKIEEEIEHRKVVVRRQALDAVKEARAHGDLSENFEYHAAKREKNQNESRIRYLERLVKTARIIEDHSAPDEIGLNSKVELYFPDDDETETYILVTSILGNSLENRISIESPLGKSIRGHKVGDTVAIQMANGASYDVVVRSISLCTDDIPIRNY